MGDLQQTFGIIVINSSLNPQLGRKFLCVNIKCCPIDCDRYENHVGRYCFQSLRFTTKKSQVAYDSGGDLEDLVSEGFPVLRTFRKDHENLELVRLETQRSCLPLEPKQQQHRHKSGAIASS
jgi:hypothetical protein